MGVGALWGFAPHRGIPAQCFSASARPQTSGSGFSATHKASMRCTEARSMRCYGRTTWRTLLSGSRICLVQLSNETANFDCLNKETRGIPGPRLPKCEAWSFASGQYARTGVPCAPSALTFSGTRALAFWRLENAGLCGQLKPGAQVAGRATTIARSL